MKNNKWLIGGVILSLGLSTTSAINVAFAQPDLNNNAKATNPENRRAGKGKGKNKGNRGANKAARQQRMLEDDLKVLEGITGKPLTDEQKQQVREALTQKENAVQQANDTYQNQIAKVAGVTPDELQFQMRQMRRNNGGQGGGGGRRGGRNRNGEQNPNGGQNAQGAMAQPDAAQAGAAPAVAAPAGAAPAGAAQADPAN